MTESIYLSINLMIYNLKKTIDIRLSIYLIIYWIVYKTKQIPEKQ